MLPSTETDACKQGDRGGRVRLGVVLVLGRTLEESSSAKDVSKEAETALGVCTRLLKTFYLKEEQFERCTE